MAALDLLETAERGQDREEITWEALHNNSTKALRTERIDFQKLLDELVNVNGIIRPTTEGSYTFAHRTFLEYFAAREARRSRETRDVILSFAYNDELIEVLYFYCGMVDNKPALEAIARALIDDKKWIEAGESLLFMKEIPSDDVVRIIVSHLERAIAIELGTEGPSEAPLALKPPLEVLCSLASRRDTRFDLADTFDRLLASDATGATALRSALATSPDTALRLIPAMLERGGDRWKSEAVQLLRDIDTEDALRELIQLLGKPDPLLQQKAGMALAGMMKTHNHLLREQALLFADKKDGEIWPLDKYFPSAVAIGIAEAIAPDGTSESEAVNNAVNAINLRRAGKPVPSAWRRVPRDEVLQRWRRRVAALLRTVGVGSVLALCAGVVLLKAYSYSTDRDLVISFMRPYFADLSPEYMRLIAKKAKAVVEEIKTRYHRPPVSGWAWLNPSNWTDDPALPASEMQAFQTVVIWGNGLWVSPFTILADAGVVREVEPLASPDTIRELNEAIKHLDSNLPMKTTEDYLSFVSSGDTNESLFFVFVFGCIILIVGYGGVWQDGVKLARLVMKSNDVSGVDSGFVLRRLATIAIPVVLLVEGAASLKWLPLVVGFALVAFGLIIGGLDWPRNKLMATIAEVKGIS